MRSNVAIKCAHALQVDLDCPFIPHLTVVLMPKNTRKDANKTDISGSERIIAEYVSRNKRLPMERHIRRAMYSEIGLLITTAAATENMLGEHLLRLISCERNLLLHAHPLVSGTDLKTKIQLYRIFVGSLVPIDAPGKRLINKWLDKIEAASQRRNDLAHGFVMPGPQIDMVEVQTMRSKAKTGEIPPAKIITKAQIRTWSWELEVYTNLLGAALTKFGYARRSP
jgi:hypothetical protein